MATLTVFAAADATVRGGVDNGLNFGGSKLLSVRASADASQDHESYLLFDLSAFDGLVGTAELRIHAGCAAGSAAIAIHGLSTPGASWVEGDAIGQDSPGSISRSSRPAVAAAVLATVQVAQAAGWVTADLSSYFQAEQSAGRDSVTIVLRGAGGAPGPIQVSSSESDRRPRLTLTVATVVPGPTIEIASPADGTFRQPDGFMDVTATASAGTTSVQYQINGQNVGAAATSEPYSRTLDLWGLGVGPHELTAVATRNGVQTSSAPIKFIVEFVVGSGPAKSQGLDVFADTAIPELDSNGWRQNRPWTTVETTAGVYNFGSSGFQNVESLATACPASGSFTNVYILGHGNTVHGNPSGPNASGARTAYGNYSRALAERLGGKCRLYEVWNEYPGGFGVSGGFTNATPEIYLLLLKAVYDKLKEGNPDAKVGGPVHVFGARPFEFNWHQDLLNVGADPFLDYYSTHLYWPPGRQFTWKPENQVRWLKDEFLPAFPGKRLTITEYGKNMQYDGYTEQGKADDFARMHLALRWCPRIIGMWWYSLSDRDPTPMSHNTFGLFSYGANPTKYPAWYACKDIALIVRRAEFWGRASNVGSTVWLMKFKDTTGDLYVAWREEDGAGSVAFSFNASASGSLAVRFVANSPTTPSSASFSFSTGSNTVTIPITTRPKLIRIVGGATLTPSSAHGFSSKAITH